MAAFPKKLGACIDLAYTRREARLALQREMEKQLEKLKADEQAIEEHIINTFSTQDINKAGGNVATASVIPSVHPSVKDWPSVWKYVKQHDAWDLLEKRIAKVAFRERLEAKQVIPGVEVFQKKTLSLTKISK